MLFTEQKVVSESMKKTISGLFICILLLFATAVCSAETLTDSYEQKRGVVPYGQNDVLIERCGVGMPLGRILLIHKDRQYCALKFTKFWTENNQTEKYATYESYYQNDGTGNLQNTNVKFSEGKASHLPLRRPYHPFLIQPGYTKVDCGFLRLQWNYKGYVTFFKGYDDDADQGIELSPTPWTNISEINVFDPRVKWYRYDESRIKEIKIPIDKIWK
jgi:hypothetical protein